MLQDAARQKPPLSSGSHAPRVEETGVGHGPGDLLGAAGIGAGLLGQRVDVRPWAGDGVERGLVGGSLMSVMGSCGDGGLDGCLGAPIESCLL